MASLESKKFRRTWPQRTLIVFSLSFVAALIFVSARLNKFDDAVGSIVRIEVPSGVLADIPTEDFEVQEDSDTPLAVTNPMFSRNFLIIGTDSAVGLDPSDPASHRDHPEGYALADVIMLVRVDPVNNVINMMSIPRDLYLPIYSQGDYIREEKIASAMLVGGLEKGAPTLVETISVNFDVPIHNFVVMDFLGFEQLIDLIGGVSMWFEHPIRDLSSKLSVNNSGCSEFDGRTSLAYVRSRKLEALVDGWWRRVGVSNDMERNQRQQEFMIRVLEELVAQGISSLLTDDDLLEAAVEMVVFDERLTLGELIDLGQAFASVRADQVIQHLLPVVDAQVGELSVLQKGEGWQSTFDVFRGSYTLAQNVPILLVNAREDDLALTVEDYLTYGGFTVQTVQSELQNETVIRSSPEQFEDSVFVGRIVTPVPKFEFVSGFSGPVELVLGADFLGFNWPPVSVEEIEVIAETYLNVGADEDAVSTFGSTGEFVMSPRRFQFSTSVEGVNGIPPEGTVCD